MLSIAAALGALLLIAGGVPTRALAGACGSWGTLGLELVAPRGEIPQGPDAGPILRVVIGSARSSRSSGGGLANDDLFRGLRIRGPRGSMRAEHQQLGPGIYRLSGRFRPGRYTLSGIETGGALQVSSATPAPLAAPALGDAVTSTSSALGPNAVLGPGYHGPSQIRMVTLHLTQSAPRGAWMLLLYHGTPNPRRGAIHFAELGDTPASRITQVSFSESGGGRRCGPSPPHGYVPTAGSEVHAAWLARDGRLSPLSNPVTVRE